MALSVRDKDELTHVDCNRDNLCLRKKRIILEEDDFISAIDAIIERDFFPDIKKLKQQLSNPIASFYTKPNNYTQETVCFNTTTPTFDTPTIHQTNLLDSGNDTIRFVSGQTSTTISRIDVRSEKEEEEEENGDDDKDKKEKIKTGLSLNDFLAKYTSEDDASFDFIMKEAEKRHRAKYPWLYLEEACKDNLALPSTSNINDEPQAITSDNSRKPLTWPYKSHNSLMFIPNEAPFLTEKDFAKNKRATIVHENTRFTRQPFGDTLNESAEAMVTSSWAKKGKVGIDGREQVSDDLTVAGYGFVPMTPSPMPGVNATPLMTWGTIEGTPRSVAGGGSTPITGTPRTPHFRIPSMSERDKIAYNLADKISKNNRDRKKEALRRARDVHSSPFSGTLGSMSPAAQRLATSKLNIGKFTDNKLRECYSPLVKSSFKDDNVDGRRTSSKG